MCSSEHLNMESKESIIQQFQLRFAPPFNTDFDGDISNIHVPQHCIIQNPINDSNIVGTDIVGQVWIGPIPRVSQSRALPNF